MISSTFTDLKKHRAALIDALSGQGLFAEAMENDAARMIDVVESSLQKVRQASAYIGVIGKKYGQVPPGDRNPEKLSITELEFNEALLLHLPILLFIMGDKHPLIEADVETNADNITKLNALWVRLPIRAVRPSNSPAPGDRPIATSRSFGWSSKTASRRSCTPLKHTNGHGPMANLMSSATN